MTVITDEDELQLEYIRGWLNKRKHKRFNRLKYKLKLRHARAQVKKYIIAYIKEGLLGIDC